MISSNYYLHCPISKHRATVRQSVRRTHKEWTASFVFRELTNAYDDLARRATDNSHRSNSQLSLRPPAPLKHESNSACTCTPTYTPTRPQWSCANIHAIRSHSFNSIAAEQPNNSIRRNNTLPAWLRMRIDLFVVTMIWSWLWYCVRNTLLDQLVFYVESSAAAIQCCLHDLLQFHRQHIPSTCSIA